MKMLMVRLIFTAIALALIAGKLGAATQETAAEPPRRVVKSIFLQPEIKTSKEVDASVIGEVQPASERFYVRLGNYGKATPMARQAWNAGRYTGFQLPQNKSPAAYQRGPMPSGEGTTVQLLGREIGIWIDSDYPRPALGSLLPVCPAYWWWDLSRAPDPFRDAHRELSFSFELKVPTAVRQGTAEVYITTNFLFRDKRSKQQFWLAAFLFDPRGEERSPDTVHLDNWEGGTQLPILFSSLNLRSQWLHPGTGSSQFTDKPFEDYRRIDVCLGPEELRAAIASMRKAMPQFAAASEDPRDYQLIHFNINPEVSAPQGSRGQLGLALRDIRVELLRR